MEIIGVRFTGGCKAYSFDPRGAAFRKGDIVIVETARGIEYGTVAAENHDDPAADPAAVKPVLRKATDRDLDRIEHNKLLKPQALRIAAEKIEARGLPMKPIDAEYAFDGSKIVIYFAAENRVDFRELVRDLASALHMRIELRQIGPRDECKMLGGLGPCGRPCCCASCMNDYARTSVKMAKTQGLSLNPTKISGLCGRLMCCLAYENAHYAETAKLMPKLGSTVETVDGTGTVAAVDMLRERVRVKFSTKDGFEFKDYTLEALKNKTASIADTLDEDDGDYAFDKFADGTEITHRPALEDDEPTGMPARSDRRSDRRGRGRNGERQGRPETPQNGDRGQQNGNGRRNGDPRRGGRNGAPNAERQNGGAPAPQNGGMQPSQGEGAQGRKRRHRGGKGRRPHGDAPRGGNGGNGGNGGGESGA